MSKSKRDVIKLCYRVRALIEKELQGACGYQVLCTISSNAEGIELSVRPPLFWEKLRQFQRETKLDSFKLVRRCTYPDSPATTIELWGADIERRACVIARWLNRHPNQAEPEVVPAPPAVDRAATERALAGYYTFLVSNARDLLRTRVPIDVLQLSADFGARMKALPAARFKETEAVIRDRLHDLALHLVHLREAYVVAAIHDENASARL